MFIIPSSIECFISLLVLLRTQVRRNLIANNSISSPTLLSSSQSPHYPNSRFLSTQSALSCICTRIFNRNASGIEHTNSFNFVLFFRNLIYELILFLNKNNNRVNAINCTTVVKFRQKLIVDSVSIIKWCGLLFKYFTASLVFSGYSLSIETAC